MTRRGIVALAVVAAVIAVAIFVALRNEQPAPAVTATAPTPAPIFEPQQNERSTVARAADAAPSPAPRDSRTSGSPLAAELNAPRFDAQHDVETLHAMLRQYLRILHGRQGHPIGNDADLARVLTGHNPMKLVVLPTDHPALSDGRLRDRWGTPYFIHPRGRLSFEIRSAGPDRRLFTADDVVANPSARATDAAAISAVEEPTSATEP